jgi:hypothetical protein
MLRTLGIEEESVRKRVSRGNMRFEKAEDGRLYVYVDGTKLTGKGYVGKSEDVYADRSVDETRRVVRELIASKDKTIRILQEAREARWCAVTIIAQLTQANAAQTQRVPELEAPRAMHQETTHGAAEGVWQGETSWTW